MPMHVSVVPAREQEGCKNEDAVLPQAFPIFAPVQMPLLTTAPSSNAPSSAKTAHTVPISAPVLLSPALPCRSVSSVSSTSTDSLGLGLGQFSPMSDHSELNLEVQMPLLATDPSFNAKTAHTGPIPAPET